MTNTDPPNNPDLRDLDPTVRSHFTSPGPSTHIVRSGDGLLPESDHLTSMDNYGLWAYRMKNILKRDELFTWCMHAPSIFPIAVEEKGRELALNSLNNNAKGNALRHM